MELPRIPFLGSSYRALIYDVGHSFILVLTMLLRFYSYVEIGDLFDDVL